jgi:hypothetical protein
LVEIGHGKVRIAATEPGTSFANRYSMLLKLVIGCKRDIGSYQVHKGGGKKGIFIIVEGRYVER